jgi:hypothetical protein
LCIMKDIDSKVRRVNKRQDMKTLISVDDVLIWEKDEEETEEKVNQ